MCAGHEGQYALHGWPASFRLFVTALFSPTSQTFTTAQCTGGGAMFHKIRKPRLVLICSALLLSVGCNKGPAVAEVVGIVKFDGKPLPNVKIMFAPNPQKGTVGPISAGLTDDQGRFKLTCEDEREGAVVGWHKVVIIESGQNLYRTPRNGRRDDDEVVKVVKVKPKGPHVPDKYHTIAKTPLEEEVKDSKNDLEITLTR